MVSGAAIAVESLAKGMASRGHHVLVIAASDMPNAYQTLDGNLKVVRLKSKENPKRVGQRYVFFPRTAVMNALKEFEPDIIHAHEPSLVWAGLEYAKHHHIPTTVTTHMLPSFISTAISNPLLRVTFEKTAWGYMKLLSQKATMLITTTRIGANVVGRKLGIRVETIPNGIDTDVLHPRHSMDDEPATRTRLNLPIGVPIILHVGRLDAEKNVDTIIRATAPLICQTNAHLVLVGDGREKLVLMELAHDLGISDRVHFTGYVSMDEGLPEIYRMANLFVLGSEVESQGLVLLEAAASGLPLVAFDTTAISEIVHDGANGYLVKPGDIPAMSAAMFNVIDDPELSARMGIESRRLSRKYDVHYVQSLHEQFYVRLFERRNATVRSKPFSWKRVKVWMGLGD
jgi:glycosyltransferase involved in cell wall biosynthesis